MTTQPDAGWNDERKVEWYLDRVGKLEARRSGEAMLLEALSPTVGSVLDLGCGDGNLCELVMQQRPSVRRVVGVDLSSAMLDRARDRFHDDDRVEFVCRDLNDPISELGDFDVVVSGFAIHHLAHDRKRGLFAEIRTQLRPGGVFANLEVIQSATPERHAEFLAAVGRDADDPEDQLATIEDQLTWMRDAGLANVDCLWRWRGLAVLAGEAQRTCDTRPTLAAPDPQAPIDNRTPND